MGLVEMIIARGPGYESQEEELAHLRNVAISTEYIVLWRTIDIYGCLWLIQQRRRTLWKQWPTMAVRWNEYDGLRLWQDHIKHGRLTKKHWWANGYNSKQKWWQSQTQWDATLPPYYRLHCKLMPSIIETISARLLMYSWIRFAKNWSIEKGKTVSNKQWHWMTASKGGGSHYLNTSAILA